MTLSGDVPAIIKPLGVVGRDNKCAGNMYCVNCDCVKKKKTKKKDLAGQVFTVESEFINENISVDMGKGKWKFKGKVGVWRTIRGRKRFFPDDGSGPIPKFEE